MNISQAAAASGVSAKMIRHYESIGLTKRAGRSQSGYRQFGQQEVEVLRFIQRARAVGFSLPEVKRLLVLWSDRRRPARDVKRLAAAHLAGVKARIAEMQSIARTLKHLLEHCHGDDRPECPILEALARETPRGSQR
jgi:MerR family copper efflux transcriptional regulator